MTQGHNGVSGEQLRELIERVERLNEVKKHAQEDVSEVFSEAKRNGFNPVIMRNIIKRRAAKPHELEEHDSLMDVYQSALGMLLDAPLFRAVGLMGVDTSARESVVDALKQLCPEKGEIIVKIGSKPVRIFRDEEGGVQAQDYVEPKRASPASLGAGRPTSPSEKPPVPDVSEEEAAALGAEYYTENKAIITNPFPAGDSRRALFDKGWRDASGGDGMGGDE